MAFEMREWKGTDLFLPLYSLTPSSPALTHLNYLDASTSLTLISPNLSVLSIMHASQDSSSPLIIYDAHLDSNITVDIPVIPMPNSTCGPLPTSAILVAQAPDKGKRKVHLKKTHNIHINPQKLARAPFR